jgi:hypothetical protein
MGLGRVRFDSERCLEAGGRFLQPAQLEERRAAIPERIGGSGIQAKRGVVVCQRFIESAECVRVSTEVVVGRGRPRREFDRARVCAKGVFEATELSVGHAEVVQRLDVVRIALQALSNQPYCPFDVVARPPEQRHCQVVLAHPA